MYDLILPARMDALAINRVGICNQVMGARYDFNQGNVFVVRGRGCRRVVSVCGRELAEWSVNELRSAETAYQRLDAVSDVLWQLRRCGYLICDDSVRSTI